MLVTKFYFNGIKIMQKVRFSIGLKLILIINTLVLISLGAVTFIVSYFTGEDTQIIAEENNHTINLRSAVSVESELSTIRANSFLLLDMISESASQCRDFYYPIRKGVEAFSNEWNLNEKIEKYAEICGMSETYFYRCFRNWSGISPIEYRNTLRLANAESMLRCTDMKINEIATTVGFEDPFYFCKLFSRKYGASPKNYRNTMRN